MCIRDSIVTDDIVRVITTWYLQKRAAHSPFSRVFHIYGRQLKQFYQLKGLKGNLKGVLFLWFHVVTLECIRGATTLS